MTPELVRLIEVTVTLLCAFAAIAAIVSGAYIAYVYRQRREEALFLSRMVTRDIRVALGGVVILGYLVLALAGHGFGRPWGAIVIGVPVILMLYGPTSNALLWRKERRGKAKP